MKHSNIIIKLVFALVIIAILLCPLTAYAEISTVNDTTNNPEVPQWGMPGSRYVIFAEGYNIAFYIEDADNHIHYRSSPYGETTWGEETDLGVTAAEGYDVAYVHPYAYYIRCQGGTAGHPMYFRRGECLANGTIEWTGEAYVCNANTGSYVASFSGFPDIDVKSDGDAWIAWNRYEGTTGHSHIFVRESQAHDGTWANTNEWSIEQNPSYYARVKMCVYEQPYETVVYTQGSTAANPGSLKAKHYFDGEWSSEASAGGTLEYWSSWSAVDSGNGVVCSWLEDASYDINISTYDTFDNTWSSAITLYESATSLSWPALQLDTDTGTFYCYWLNDPSDDVVYYSVNEGVGWSSYQVYYGNGTTSSSKYIECVEQGSSEVLGAYWWNGSGHMRYLPILDEEEPAAPLGWCYEVEDVGNSTATLTGKVLSDGTSDICEAEFRYQSASDAGVCEIEGYVETDDLLECNATGLMPGMSYFVYLYLSSEYGENYSNTQEFTTDTVEVSMEPVVETLDNNHEINLYSNACRLYGLINYDGGLPCVGGFAYRVQGTEAWTTFEIPGYVYRTGQQVTAWIGTSAGTIYEYKAWARNTVGTGWGEIVVFTSGVTPTVLPTGAIGPTATPGPGIVPPWLSGAWATLSDNVKMLLAVLGTILGMVLVGLKSGRSKASGILVIGVGIALTVLFSLIHWYPSWVIILLGGVIALLVFISIMGGRR